MAEDQIIGLVAAKTAALAHAALTCDRNEFDLQREDVRRVIASLDAADSSAALDALAEIPFCAAETETGAAMLRLLTEVEKLVPS